MTDPTSALAEAVGIAPRYIDQMEGIRETPPETARALLTAMGIEAATGAEAAESLARIRAEVANRILPRTVVVEVDTAPALAPRRPGLDWRLTMEDGTERAGRFAEDGSGLPKLPLGIHRLEVAGQPTTLLSAPPRLPSPARGWGITLPLYGLRTQEEGGLGSYRDLAVAASGCTAAGADFVGVNPIHAGFPADPDTFSPYAPSHRRRFNVMHVAPRFEPAAPGEALIDYRAATAVRRAALEADFAAFEAGDTAAFEAFLAGEGPALRQFATHQALSDRNGAFWTDWPADLRDPGARAVADFAAREADLVRFHAWLQWQAEAQLDDVRRAMAGARMGLYLDLAVGTHPAGAETWAEPGIFARGVSLGAPPDRFAADGQTWGLAPLVPRALEEAAFRPLAETLRMQLRFADLLRIDHILGFERTFWVPEGGGLPGAYLAMPKAAMLAVVRIEAARAGATIIGEDLGNIPEGLREDLDASGILGCRVVTFERDWDAVRERGAEAAPFRPPEAYDPETLASFGTHDLPTYLGWRQGCEIDWRARLGSIDEGLAREAHDDRDAAVGAFDAAVARHAGGAGGVDGMHAFLARTRSALVAVQVEDVLGLVEQPNLPGTVFEHPNWRRRLPVAAPALGPHSAIARTAAIMQAEGRSATAQTKGDPDP